MINPPIPPLKVLYQDDSFVAVNKPPGHVVHRSSTTRNAPLVVLQQLRDQLKKKVYPIHRLDRKTSGVLLFALDAEALQKVNKSFQDQTVKKEYTALVRGWTSANDVIDYDLTNDKGKTQQAITAYTTIKHYEIGLPNGKFRTSRYSEVRLLPKTGRMHQLRKHMAHIFHPIIGDRPHGCNKQNRLWKHTFQMDTMMLHAKSLSFIHPFTNTELEIEAPFFDEYVRAKDILESAMKSKV